MQASKQTIYVCKTLLYEKENKVKETFFNFHAPFGREFQGGQEYVRLAFP
jgi:hypothetical protein